MRETSACDHTKKANSSSQKGREMRNLKKFTLRKIVEHFEASLSRFFGCSSFSILCCFWIYDLKQFLKESHWWQYKGGMKSHKIVVTTIRVKKGFLLFFSRIFILFVLKRFSCSSPSIV